MKGTNHVSDRWSGNITSVLTVGFFAHLQSVLHFMTGYTSSEESAAVSQDVVRVLVLSGLMKWYLPISYSTLNFTQHCVEDDAWYQQF